MDDAKGSQSGEGAEIFVGKTLPKVASRDRPPPLDLQCYSRGDTLHGNTLTFDFA